MSWEDDFSEWIFGSGERAFRAALPFLVDCPTGHNDRALLLGLPCPGCKAVV